MGLLPPPSTLASVATLPSNSTPAPYLLLSFSDQLLHQVAQLCPHQDHHHPPTNLSGAAALHPASGGLLGGSHAISGLILSPVLEPTPQHLVKRIRSGQFVEMLDLLCDSIALHDQLKAIQDYVNLAAIPDALCLTSREVRFWDLLFYCLHCCENFRCSIL